MDMRKIISWKFNENHYLVNPTILLTHHRWNSNSSLIFQWNLNHQMLKFARSRVFAFHTSCQNANSKITFDLETWEDWSNRILELLDTRICRLFWTNIERIAGILGSNSWNFFVAWQLWAFGLVLYMSKWVLEGFPTSTKFVRHLWSMPICENC